MISASDSAPASADKKAADGGGVVAAISMPRSSAAVLTLVSTPAGPESCGSDCPGEAAEVPWDEGDRGIREVLGSSAMETKIYSRSATGSRAPSFAPQPIGYHAQPSGRNPGHWLGRLQLLIADF